MGQLANTNGFEYDLLLFVGLGDKAVDGQIKIYCANPNIKEVGFIFSPFSTQTTI